MIEPNAWMRCFDIDEKFVKGINSQIIETVRQYEKDAEKLRRAQKKHVFGAAALREQRLFKPHKPKKKNRKIFVLSSIKELRIAIIQEVKELCAYCRELYDRREFHLWPPGMRSSRRSYPRQLHCSTKGNSRHCTSTAQARAGGFRPPAGILASAVQL